MVNERAEVNHSTISSLGTTLANAAAVVRTSRTPTNLTVAVEI